MTELSSAPVPPVAADDHVRGPADAALVIEYADFECPYCAALSARLAARQLRRVFRHFPVRSGHPRAWPAACAAEAAGVQGRFWEMHDLLFGDQGRLEDPHLWQRAGELGLDLARFDSDRRSEEVIARVRRDFESGIRAGVVTTPTLSCGGVLHPGKVEESTLIELERGFTAG
ncbi:MAG TPA: thioredoxin domain-containing protein [Solirubrobacteraceae bacterium]|jgi:protein-disulfide isomerase|nr:thioredoxin domain-containing protein [Solirubrobacteraceae bacterium]